MILDGTILNADISASAAIAYSKLALTGAVLNADLAGSIAASKLVGTDITTVGTLSAGAVPTTLLTGTITNAQLAGSIAYSKLSLTGAVLNADLAGSIDGGKISGGTFGAVNGSALTGLAAANITGTNTLPDGVLSTNVPLLNAANTFTAANIVSTAGAASAPGLKISGKPYAGNGNTSFPQLYVNDSSATASSTLSAAGTYLGVNGHGSADLANFMLDGTSRVKVGSAGNIVAISTAGLVLDARSTASAAACMSLTNLSASGYSAFDVYTSGSAIATGFGYANSSAGSFPGLAYIYLNGTNFVIRNNGGAAQFFSSTAGIAEIPSAGLFAFSSGSQANGTIDTNISRNAAGVVQIGTGAANAGGSLTCTNGTFSGTVTLTGGIAGKTDASNATAGNVGEYVSVSVAQGSAAALTTATAKTIASITLTAGDWDVTGIGCLTGASTGTVFDIAVGTTANSFTGTVLGDTRCQSPTVSLTGADSTLMIPAARVSINATTTYYLIVAETFTVGAPSAYGRISARRVR